MQTPTIPMPATGAATNTSGNSSLGSSVPINLRPVLFVVDATLPPKNFGTSSHGNSPDDFANYGADSNKEEEPFDEPFDERRVSTDSGVTGSTTTSATEEGEDENLFESFLKALQGRPSTSDTDDISYAASYDSNMPFSPERNTSSSISYNIGSPDDSAVLAGTPAKTGSASASSPYLRGMSPFSPFSRLRPKWRRNEAEGRTASNALAEDIMEEDDHDEGQSNSGNGSNFTSSSLYSKDPPVHFMARRARVVSVSRRHAFPPSKYPYGRGEGGESGGAISESSWVRSYDLGQEGILPSGWLEKHARALPSALVVVATIKDLSVSAGVDRHVVQAVEDLRTTLADKRNVPIHLVCLVKQPENEKKEDGGSSTCREQSNMLKERVAALANECILPPNQVSTLRYPIDLEPDEWENAVLRSPYLPGAPPLPGSLSSPSTNDNTQSTTDSKSMMMNPLLRSLDRTLRDSSALYYSRLADRHEQKLSLWRNRYNSTNTSFELNTLLAAMRCARYSMKVATLREFQLRTGANSSWATGPDAQKIGGGAATQWMDKGSLAMRNYEEAYRWVIELHRRAVMWRAQSQSMAGDGDNRVGPPPATPANSGAYNKSNQVTSPRITESPGGGIGVELSLPAGTAARSTVAPPPPISTPIITPSLGVSKRGSDAIHNLRYFSNLWEQCRAIASVINAKLLRSSAASSAHEAVEQWRRHRQIFLAIPQGIPGFDPSHNDDFFGPVWHRVSYVTREIFTLACIAEGRWRRIAIHIAKNSGSISASAAPSPLYHQPLAPWKAYGDLAEALINLSREINRESQGGIALNTSITDSDLHKGEGTSLGRRRYVGSIVAGDNGVGTMQWLFENESKQGHQGIALEHILHALNLLEENASICQQSEENETPDPPPTTGSLKQPTPSAKLHYMAGRLLMKLGNHLEASEHLKIAANVTKKWPSLHLAIRRALISCIEQCSVKNELSLSPTTGKDDIKNSSLELLLRLDLSRLMTSSELAEAWKVGSEIQTNATTREVLWTDDGETRPPFEFGVSFLKSTHAATRDNVTVCASIKSCLGFPVFVESVQMLTTSGLYEVSNLNQCVNEHDFRHWLNTQNQEQVDGLPRSSYSPFHSVKMENDETFFFLTEISLPSSLEDVAYGKSSVDLSKFVPKNGRLCNMGFTHAAGNVCESRFQDNRQQINLTGKPVPVSELNESDQSFIGGVPLVCYGLILVLSPFGKNQASGNKPLIRLQIERPQLMSPLRRSGNQKFLMEECNYMAHSWIRPNHHPWCLGPRCLRVLGPRPKLEVINLTEKATKCIAIEGTVNRVMLMLKAGDDEDCRDIRIQLTCKNTKNTTGNEGPTDVLIDNESNDVEPSLSPVFVQKSLDPCAGIVTSSGVALPKGWEPRKDVTTNESNDISTMVKSHLGAGESLLLPIDFFRPLSQTPSSAESDMDAGLCLTSYEVFIRYKQIRTKKNTNSTDDSGDEAMVSSHGSLTWITPFSAEFSFTNGPQKLFPCGIQHPSNMVTKSALKSNASEESEIIAVDGEQIRMRCFLESKQIGNHVVADILQVSREDELASQEEVLYSSDIDKSTSQPRQGSKLALSYSIAAKRNNLHSHEVVSIPLGRISVKWKPISLSISDDALVNGVPSELDSFGMTHGPLSLNDISPKKFYGPLCQVFIAPFHAKLKKSPSTPTVGHPFRISYEITNKTAKSQTLSFSLNDSQDENSPAPDSKLLVTGMTKGEIHLAPFEEKIFSFTFMSMVAGKVLRPPLLVSSVRHQLWVINETPLSSRYLFVMP